MKYKLPLNAKWQTCEPISGYLLIEAKNRRYPLSLVQSRRRYPLSLVQPRRRQTNIAIIDLGHILYERSFQAGRDSDPV